MFQSRYGSGGNGARRYHCANCDALITHSDQLLDLGGANRHLFVNPAGVPCDFHTFYGCSGAVVLGQATGAHTWFPGYHWRIALCRQCGQHLGWHYESMSGSERPVMFWGILVDRTVKR